MKKFTQAADIKVGVIGYGSTCEMGKSHLAEMQRAGMTPVAVAEIDPVRLKVASEDFPGIKTYDSVDKLLATSEANLLTIITPHNTHTALALQCLKAGRHVVCEKPLAITTEECDEMIAMANKQELMLSTYHNRHWDGCILEAVKRIGEGAIGEVVRIEGRTSHFGKPRDWWRSSKTISGGILYDWGVHILEYSLQLLTGDMTEVSGYAKRGIWAEQTTWKADTTEDEAYAIVRFNNGKWLTLHASTIDANPKRGMLDIVGATGTYIMHADRYEIITPDANPSTIIGPNMASEGWKFYQNVADHLVRDVPLVITAEWARRPIHILDLAVQSAEKGHSLPAKYR